MSRPDATRAARREREKIRRAERFATCEPKPRPVAPTPNGIIRWSNGVLLALSAAIDVSGLVAP